ncbi:hypothetical protein HY212_00525 [Candidatus Pacearchaeota archaeon]|nr:hypothetical protein [Candidatus Pacearchaeota archaeon]
MNLKLAAVPILALVISLSTIGFVNAESNDTSATASGQTNASCSQDDITAAKQGLADIQKKMADIKTQYYNDWQTAHDSGQYNGTFEQYVQEKISSSDISQLKSDYQKYNSILRSCGVAGHMMKRNAPSTTCSKDDVSHARQELATSEKRGMDLRNKIYQQFQTDQASGQFNGTWAQYAKENFYNLPEIVQIKSTHDKFSSFLKSCFGNKVPHQRSMPQNLNDNRMPPQNPNNDNSNYTSNPSDLNQNTGGDFGLTGNSNFMPPTDQFLNPIPPISSPTDALSTIASHSIPGWVRGIAGWWAQGKISDDEFVSAIKFLIHQGIIKV